MTVSTRKLTLADISDLRAYEREREEFRAGIIELKKRRRIAVGPFVTLVFENRDTIRFQIQEMARAERLMSDDAIQVELDVYNPLIPEPGTLSATLFIELTSKPELEEWLPRLVGIERAVVLRIAASGDDTPALSIAATPDAAHEQQLTRETITPSVHYVHFALDEHERARFAEGHVRVGIEHRNYSYAAELGETAVAELLADLRE